MKTFMAVILSAFVIFGNNFCSAEMARNEMYLGGLTFGSSTAQMLRMYKAPDKTEGGVEQLYDCNYGNSVKISYNAYNNKIFKITVLADNGWKTPKGLAVGMPISQAIEFYGNADFEKYGAEKAVYAYFHSNGKENDFGFVILVDNYTDKILAMEITGNNPMVLFDDFFENKINYMLGIENE